MIFTSFIGKEKIEDVPLEESDDEATMEFEEEILKPVTKSKCM